MSYPIEEIKSLRGDLIYSGTNVEVTPDSANILDGKQGVLLDIEGEFTLGDGVTDFGFKLRQGNGQETIVKYDVQSQQLVLDKSNSGQAYNGVPVMEMIPMEGNKVKLRILVDTTVIDAFGNDGEAVIMTCYFPDPESNGMEFFTNGGNVTVDSLNIYSMNSAWKEQEEPEPIPTELSGLELSTGTLEPTFDKDTLNYTATVANSVSSVKVMPTYTGDTAVTVNGKDVASGSYSEDIALEVGPNAITVVAGEKTYTIVVTREAAGGTPDPEEPEPTPGTDKPSIPGSDEDQAGGGDWDWPSGSGNSSANGSGSGNSDKENPSSGDHSMIAGALAVLALSAGVAVVLSRKKK